MKKFIVPIGIIFYIAALIFYNPRIPDLLSDVSIEEINNFPSKWLIIKPKLYTFDDEEIYFSSNMSLYNKSPCVDRALSIISILERYSQLGDSIQLAVSSNHVQVIKFFNNEMEFLKLDNNMNIIYGENEFTGTEKLKFFSVNDFKMATTLLPPLFSLDMLTDTISNFNNPKILFDQGDYIEFKR